jgi:hypothetical protein
MNKLDFKNCVMIHKRAPNENDLGYAPYTFWVVRDDDGNPKEFYFYLFANKDNATWKQLIPLPQEPE